MTFILQRHGKKAFRWLLLALLLMATQIAAATDNDRAKDNPFLSAEYGEVIAEDRQNIVNNHRDNDDGSSAAKPQSLRRRQLQKKRKLATFPGRKLATGCEGGRTSTTNNDKNTSPRGPPPSRLPDPPERPVKNGRRHRRLRDRTSLIDGVVEGDEADVTTPSDNSQASFGRTGVSIHDSKAGRGGADRGSRGGDDDDGGSSKEDEEETVEEEEEPTEEEVVEADPDCEDDVENPDFGDGIQDNGQKTYIITYKENMDNEAMIDTAATVEFTVESNGGQIEQVYTEVLNGVAATLTKEAAIELSQNPGVESVEEDSIAYIDQGPATWGIDRIDQQNGRNNNYRWLGNTNAGNGVNVCVRETSILLILAN